MKSKSSIDNSGLLVAQPIFNVRIFDKKVKNELKEIIRLVTIEMSIIRLIKMYESARLL